MKWTILFVSPFLLTVLLFWEGITVSTVAENLGTLNLDEWSLGSEFLLTEGQIGEFSLIDTIVGGRWKWNKNISAHINLGSLSLLNKPSHFTQESDTEWGLVEGYAEFQSVYGKARMGLIPLQYAKEGSFRESQLDWPRSLLYRKRVVGLRDFGFQYLMENEGYYTRLAVHNGESGLNKDGRFWITGTWGWTDSRLLEWGVSGQTGTTKPISTSESKDNLAEVNPQLAEKWKMGTLFMHWTPNQWSTLVEVTWGGLEQSAVRNQFFSSHTDLSYKWNDQNVFLFRYDFYDPNGLKKSSYLKDRPDSIQVLIGKVEREISVGWMWQTQEGNSRWYLLGTKVVEDGNHQINNDQIRLLWRLNAESFSPFRSIKTNSD